MLYLISSILDIIYYIYTEVYIYIYIYGEMSRTIAPVSVRYVRNSI